MPLALGKCEMVFQIDTAWEQEVYRTARLALFDLAEDCATDISTSPDTPEDTHALKDSIRVAPPGYNQDDTPLVVRAGRPDPIFDPPVALNANQSRSPRATTAQAMAGHRGVLIAGGASSNAFSGGADEFVEDDGSRLHTRVGSWVYYAWWVHQGYYNVRAGRNLPGRPYITQVAQPKLLEFPAYFRKRWLAERYRGPR